VHDRDYRLLECAALVWEDEQRTVCSGALSAIVLAYVIEKTPDDAGPGGLEARKPHEGPVRSTSSNPLYHSYMETAGLILQAYLGMSSAHSRCDTVSWYTHFREDFIEMTIAELHPLALEDVLHQPRSGLLSKVDYYKKHSKLSLPWLGKSVPHEHAVFMRVLCHTLAKGEDHEHDPMLYTDPTMNHSYGNLAGGITGLPRSTSPDGEKGYDVDRTVTNSQRRTFSRFSAGKRATDGLPFYTEKPESLPPAPRMSTSSQKPHQSDVGVLLLCH
jgi:hypothetical protein